MSSLLVRDNNAQISRVTTLALPKTFHRDFVEDKRSVYWDNGLSKSWPCNEPTQSVATQRVAELSRHKDLSRHKMYPDKLSAVSVVSRAAQGAEPTTRLEALAQPKQPPRAYAPPRAPQSVVTRGAQQAEASARLEALAKPKAPRESALRDGTEFEWCEWQSNVTDAAKKATASERVEALAVPKQPVKDYMGSKSPFWHANSDVKMYTASERLATLSNPVKHPTVNEEDRSVWKVRVGAMLAVPSERVEELAKPLPRKQRTKK
ncbi:sperm microtubule associated protein 2-like [Sycon ciliatum]|uniref:sperm microtubule associated protein 2-like n=1 Tax=Sycon ciliatum TaxID=27933 RepID=UPI0031F7157E